MGKKISGRVCGKSSHDTKLCVQLPHIIRQFRELEKCYATSVHLELDRPLLVQNPDFETTPFLWAIDPERMESFRFLRATCPGVREVLPVWLLLPSSRGFLTSVDVIGFPASYVASFNTGNYITLNIPKKGRVGKCDIV